MEFLTIENETEESFEHIAQVLFDQYVIQTHASLYRLLEIEVYWNSITHRDNSTYKRIHADPNSGEWFFHYSGVDIALKDERTGAHGGILIRGIYDIVKKQSTKGPMVCAMKLFSCYNAFTSTIKTQIIPYTFSKSIIIKKTRFWPL